MNTSYLTAFTVIIPAHRKEARNITGQKFYCKTATAPYGLIIDQQPEVPMQAGNKFDLGPGNSFRVLTFVNATATPIIVTFNFGTVDFSFDSPPVENQNVTSTNAANLFLGNSIQTLASGSQVKFEGTVGGRVRRQIIVTNLSPTNDLYIADAHSDLLFNQGGVVFPRSSWTLETSDDIYLVNASADPIDYVVGGTWYP